MRSPIPLVALATLLAVLAVPPGSADEGDGVQGVLRISYTFTPALGDSERQAGDWHATGTTTGGLAAVCDMWARGVEVVNAGAGSGGNYESEAGTCTVGTRTIPVSHFYWQRIGAATRLRIFLRFADGTPLREVIGLCAADTMARPAPVTAYDMACAVTT